MQALVNLIDHGMSLQEAVEAPRVWTEGNALEVEQTRAGQRARQNSRAWATRSSRLPTVAGGMNAIAFHDDGSMTGAACWRADGTPVGISGGLARRAGVRFEAELIATSARRSRARRAAFCIRRCAVRRDSRWPSENRARCPATPARLALRGPTLARPATSAGFSSAIPANLPSPSIAGLPENPTAGGGDSAEIAARDRCQRALDARDAGRAALALRDPRCQ